MEDSPRTLTRTILPERMGGGGRLWAATRALFGTGASAGTAGSRTYASGAPTATELTLHRPLGAMERIRNTWRETDYVHRLDIAIAQPRLAVCPIVAVVSPKGGVGKTTISALLGTLLALVRRDRIVAIDSNPDFGSVGRWLVPDHEIYVDDMLEVLSDRALTVADLDRRLGRGPHGLMVLPAPIDPGRMARLGEEEYTSVIRRLQELVGVLVLDCGTGLQDPAVRAAIGAADQLVLVSDSEPATASLVAEAGKLLAADKIPMLVVVNKMPAGGAARLNVERLAEHVPFANGLVVVPSDQDAAARLARGEFSWTDAPAGWQTSIRELAATLIAEWPTLGLTSA